MLLAAGLVAYGTALWSAFVLARAAATSERERRERADVPHRLPRLLAGRAEGLGAWLSAALEAFSG